MQDAREGEGDGEDVSPAMDAVLRGGWNERWDADEFAVEVVICRVYEDGDRMRETVKTPARRVTQSSG